MNSVSLCAADEAAQKLGKETGHPERLAALAVDVSDAKSIEAAAQTLEQDYAGKLGGLINNAGVRTDQSLRPSAIAGRNALRYHDGWVLHLCQLPASVKHSENPLLSE